MKKVSVILPVYNVEQYLTKCLESLVTQTLKDIEIICINDGSTDSSLRILNNFASKDNRIIIVNQENQGPGRARNLGIELSKGEYLAFVDPDDWLDTNTLECLYNKAKEFDVDIVEFNYKEIYEDSQQIKYHNLKIKLPEGMPFNFRYCKKYLFGTNLVSWNRIYRTDFINQYDIRFGDTRKAQDTIFSIGAKIHAQKILYINKPFYNYLIRSNSSVNSISAENLKIINCFQDVKALLQRENLYEEYKKEFVKNVIRTLSTRYNSVPEELKEKFLENSKSFLGKDYQALLKNIKRGGDKFWESIFSVKNEYDLGCKKQKVITILGFKIRLSKNM